MSILLISALVIASLVLFITKRNKETGLTLGLCLALGLHWMSVLTYIAKKGGIGRDMQILLFGTVQVRHALQYLVTTLQGLGYVMAVGRYLTPLLLMWLALNYSMDPAIRRRKRLYLWACVLPVLSLIVYYPPLFEALTHQNQGMLLFLVNFSLCWIVAYLVIVMGLLIHEYRGITIAYYRRPFFTRFAMVVSLSLLYALYCPQDPAQVYLFYRNEYMGAQQGLWYLSPALSMTNYIIVMTAVILCSAVGFITLVRHTQDSIREGQEEVAIQRKFDAASSGVNVFVHSVKNQLLANRVLLKRLGAALDQPQPDPQRLEELHRNLVHSNEMMLKRMEELYQGVKSRSITLVPTPLEEVCQAARERFLRKHPDAQLRMDVPEDVQVLCDKIHLAEALYNLLANGWEAQVAAGRPESPLELILHRERLWTVLEVRDKGVGLSAAQKRKIYDPFYSEKNAAHNWGMGLYYVRAIVRSHLGVMRVDSVPGQGSSFYLQLPKYDDSERR